VAVPPPVTADAKPNGVPVTTEEIARAERLLGSPATRLPKAKKVAMSKDFIIPTCLPRRIVKRKSEKYTNMK